MVYFVLVSPGLLSAIVESSGSTLDTQFIGLFPMLGPL